jgi:hypothetical protein
MTRDWPVSCKTTVMNAVSFLLGGLVGAAVALFLAPRAGRDARGLSRRGLEAKTRALGAAATMRETRARLDSGVTVDDVANRSPAAPPVAAEPAAPRPRKSRKKAGEKKRAAETATPAKQASNRPATRGRVRGKRPRDV